MATYAGGSQMSRVFIMGGTGFIGTEAVRELLARGDTVYGLARSAATEHTLRRLGAIPIPGDVYEPDRWIGQLPSIDYAINVLGFFTDGIPLRLSLGFAATSHEKYVRWARALIRVAREKRVKSAVHVTGTTIFEPSDTAWVNEQTSLRYEQDGFNRITWQATQVIVDAIETGVPIVVAVAPNVVYGPVPESSFDKVFVSALRAGRMGITGHGKNYIPTGHVEDVGRAVAFLTDERFAREFFLISGDDAVTQREFLHALARGIGKKRVLQLPRLLVSLLGGKAAAEFMSLSQRVDNSKLKQAGFVLKYPRFAATIGPMMEQFERARAVETRAPHGNGVRDS
jgi:nucleoside-diphosphate-sugar epimerase